VGEKGKRDSACEKGYRKHKHERAELGVAEQLQPGGGVWKKKGGIPIKLASGESYSMPYKSGSKKKGGQEKENGKSHGGEEKTNGERGGSNTHGSSNLLGKENQKGDILSPGKGKGKKLSLHQWNLLVEKGFRKKGGSSKKTRRPRYFLRQGKEKGGAHRELRGEFPFKGKKPKLFHRNRHYEGGRVLIRFSPEKK